MWHPFRKVTSRTRLVVLQAVLHLPTLVNDHFLARDTASGPDVVVRTAATFVTVYVTLLALALVVVHRNMALSEAYRPVSDIFATIAIAGVWAGTPTSAFLVTEAAFTGSFFVGARLVTVIDACTVELIISTFETLLWTFSPTSIIIALLVADVSIGFALSVVPIVLEEERLAILPFN